jgi:hypothetical protein
VRLNRVVASASLAEPSAEIRHAEVDRAKSRPREPFGLLQQRNDLSFREPLQMTSGVGDDGMEVDEEKGEVGDMQAGWEKIQEYGKYLGQTAELFRTDVTSTPPPTATHSPQQTMEERRKSSTSSFISPIEQLQWKHFRFASDFEELAPLTSRENRIHAQQTTNLIDWISDPANDALFRGWSGVGQLCKLRKSTEEERQRREDQEVEALERILEVRDEGKKLSRNQSKGELGWHSVGMGTEGRPSSLAKYLSQDAPPSKRRRLEGSVSRKASTTSEAPSRSNSTQTGGSDEDARSIVAEDNHWRRTIFG